MKKVSCLAAMMLLIVSSLIVPASSLEQFSQTVYVYDGDFNGTPLSGVQIAGQDAAGKSFSGITDANGIANVSGQAGEWLFVFIKDGYETLDLNYNVSETGEGAVYLVKSNNQMEQNTPSQSDQQPETILQADAAHQTQPDGGETALAGTGLDQDKEIPVRDVLTQSASTLDQVSQTVYVYDGDFYGSLLVGVQIIGQDSAGKSIRGITDANGVAVLSGQAGEWLFEFEKGGYETLKLRYNVTETGEGAVYLVRFEEARSNEVRSDGTSEQVVPYPGNQESVFSANGIDERQSSANAASFGASTLNQEQERQEPTVSQKTELSESETASAEFWLLEGNSLYEQGRYDEAAESYDRCILLNSQIEAAWFNKGNALYMQGDYDNALSAFDKAIQISPQDANAWICRGLTLKKLGRNLESNTAFMQAKELGYTN